jgi:hypothetical protein
MSLWQSYWEYATDVSQRSILFWDVMRQRGNQYLEHEAKPVQHVLHYDFEKVMDGRDLARPVNYGLVRIRPPKGVEIDEDKRPFVVVDPRAGHGPGIGGFKPDSQVGAILNAGHPCYFIGFLSDPVPGQTIADVGRAEVAFLERVAELHPSHEGKPCVIANCQAGWAMMMLAAVVPDVVGPLLIAGSPLSYWAGVRGKNPMRYTGGLLGGTWLAALAGDLGHGIFDGAHLVSNFENLNPANTLWGKNYSLWSKIDTEAPRYLEFERWWGGHVLLTDEEMQFIADELFVGNRLVKGEMQTSDGSAIDLRNIRSPIVVFCSHGDNITPPQQALHWILDLYENVDEIRAYGQTIVYSLHENIGHLGIFVSGRVGRKEHDQFTQNMDLIDVLPPGLYEVVIREKTEEDSNKELAYGDYIVTFESRTLDDIRALGDQDNDDNRAFEAVARVSEINQSLYKTFVSPLVRGAVSEQSAEWMRQMHPARLQYSLFSDRNPFMDWTAPAADSVRSARQPVGDNNPYRVLERQVSDGIMAWLDLYRDLRDQAQEQFFFTVYGSEAMQALVGLRPGSEEKERKAAPHHPAQEALIREKIRDLKQRIGSGGAHEAAVRALIYVGLPEGRIDERGFGALKHMHEQAPEDKRMSLLEFKQLIREQTFMLLLDEEQALATLPDLLPDDPKVRRELFDKVLKVTTAARPPSEERRSRLRDLAERFGLDADAAIDGRPIKVVAKEQPDERPMPTRPVRRTPSARASRRGNAARG